MKPTNPTTLRRHGRTVAAWQDGPGSFPSWSRFLSELPPGGVEDTAKEAVTALLHGGKQGRIATTLRKAFASAASNDEEIKLDVVFPLEPADFNQFDRAMAVFTSARLSRNKLVELLPDVPLSTKDRFLAQVQPPRKEKRRG